MRNSLLWALAFSMVAFAACQDDEDPPTTNDDNNNGGGDPIEVCDTLTATYDANVGGIINANCATSGCHTGDFPANGLNLSTYEDVKTAGQKENFLGAIKHEQGFVPMPYAKPQLSDSLIQILDCWVNKEFPEN